MEDGRKCAKLVNICVAISISKMEENVKMEENISGILCFIISRKVKTQWEHKKRFVQCMEKML